jgi:hypothetical protein
VNCNILITLFSVLLSSVTCAVIVVEFASVIMYVCIYIYVRLYVFKTSVLLQLLGKPSSYFAIEVIVLNT